MADSDVDISPWRDLYAAMGEPLGEGAWSLRLYNKPLIRWVWLGAIIMSIGGAIAALDRRYAMRRRREVASAAWGDRPA